MRDTFTQVAFGIEMSSIGGTNSIRYRASVDFLFLRRPSFRETARPRHGQSRQFLYRLKLPTSSAGFSGSSGFRFRCLRFRICLKHFLTAAKILSMQSITKNRTTKMRATPITLNDVSATFLCFCCVSRCRRIILF